MIPTEQKPQILRDLGDGLVMRRSVPADVEKLAEFNSRIHQDARVGIWVRDLLLKPHPTFHTDDFTIIEDTSTGQIVSSVNLISQTWTYGGIPFGVGRPELVGTEPAYRNRRLVGPQFDVVHEWSRQRGELAQAITGIPYYYRQFGYEMTLALGGGRSGSPSALPALKEGESEPFRLRAAQETDLPFILELYARGSQRYLINADLDETCWRYEMSGMTPGNCNWRVVLVMESAAGEPAGIVTTPDIVWNNDYFPALLYELKAGFDWYGPTASLLRYLAEEGSRMATEKGKLLKEVGLNFGSEHPSYEVSKNWLPKVRRPYAYYMRVPDLPAFLTHVAPALEDNLARSVMAGYSGELKISFYRSGLIMRIEKGKLVEVSAWKPGVNETVTAAFPDHTFLHLVFGHRSMDELRNIYTDCYDENDGQVLMDALFPKRPSDVQVLS